MTQASPDTRAAIIAEMRHRAKAKSGYSAAFVSEIQRCWDIFTDPASWCDGCLLLKAADCLSSSCEAPGGWQPPMLTREQWRFAAGALRDFGELLAEPDEEPIAKAIAAAIRAAEEPT